MQAFGLSRREICEFRDKLFEIGDLEQGEGDHYNLLFKKILDKIKNNGVCPDY